MEVLHDRVAGLDVHKATVVACVRTPGSGRSRRSETREFKTFLGDLGRLRGWLASEGVSHVAMEATGVYWKPVWFALEELEVELLLVNSRNMRMVPGRKTDVADAAWIAQLLEVGLLRGSFVPPPVIRELRDLTRYRKRLVQDRTREGQRVEKVLEDAGIKLASVASQTLGKSGRAMIDALVAGERDPLVLAELAKKRLRAKIPDLQRALVGRFGEHHAAMLRLHLAHIDHLDALTAALDEQIEYKLVPFADALARLETIPGVGRNTAEVLIAEIGADMSVFPTAAHLASWCGICPGNNESAGKQRSGRTNPSNPWLADALVHAAWAAARTKNTWLSARFWRLSRRIGKKKALVAIAHSIVIAVWHIHTEHVDYNDLGVDWWARHNDPRAEAERLVRRLTALGHRVTLEPAA
jgi:transposase